MSRHLTQTISGILIALCAAVAARADTFVLGSGGRIEGALVNAADDAQETYTVALATGGQVTLNKNQVTRIVKTSSAEAQYDQFLQKMPIDLDGHWKMAEWCVRNNLKPQREFHLQEVVRLDPAHEKARLALGYTKIDDKWVRPDDHNQRLGYVKYKGAWRTPQDVLMAEARDKVVDAERTWKADVKRWRDWLDHSSKAAEGAANFAAIRDPLAAKPIADLLDEKNEPAHYRLSYVEILGRLANDSGFARGILVNHTLYDADEQIREKCLDELMKCDQRAVGAMFAVALGDKKNEVVNRAAVGIARMKYKTAIPALISALETKHKYIVNTGGGPGAIGAGFGAGGGGLGVGGKGPQQIERSIQNSQVHAALLALTDGQDHGYDQKAWRAWYATAQAPQKEFNLRRRP